MSGLEDRCIQFHEAAMGTGKSKGAAKEIALLRRFLHKNQTQRFTDKATSRLFDTIQLYTTGKSGDVALEDREGLLEDALKMPFTVFTTKQKKTMLKWIEEIRGANDGGKTSTTGVSPTRMRLSVMDLEEDKLSLLREDTGDTYDDIPLPAGELGNQIKSAFESSDDAVDVEATIEDGQLIIARLCK